MSRLTRRLLARKRLAKSDRDDDGENARDGDDGREEDEETEDVDGPVTTETVESDEDDRESECAGAEDLRARSKGQLWFPNITHTPELTLANRLISMSSNPVLVPG